MNIYIDESGSFVSTNSTNSWNCVAAYVTPEVDTRNIRMALKRLKATSSLRTQDEIKLKHVTEDNYVVFLNSLGKLNGTLFSVATDSSFNSIANIKSHQSEQVSKILQHKPKMKYDGGKDGIQLLSDQLKSLSPQLYAQLHCQVHLIFDFIQRGIVYHVQRHPKSLGCFRWRIDQKNTSKTIFEDAFEKITPAVLQTMSFREPMIMLKGEDYSAFSAFEYKKGEGPTYLKDYYGINLRDDPGLNLGKLIRDNIKFEDSKQNQGVQVVDLLASGIRRCLRNEFNNNQLIAKLLGSLMLAQKHKEPPIRLIGFEDGAIKDNSAASLAIKEMTKSCRELLV